MHIIITDTLRTESVLMWKLMWRAQLQIYIFDQSAGKPVVEKK